MREVNIEGVNWNCEEPYVPFEQFVSECPWAYKQYSDQDRLTLLKLAYSFKYKEVTCEQPNGSFGNPAGS